MSGFGRGRRHRLGLALVLAVVAFPAAGAGSVRARPINDGLPTKWFGVTAGELRNGYWIHTGSTVTFILAHRVINPTATIYQYKTAGDAEVEFGGTDDMGCRWSGGPYTRPVSTNAGQLSFLVYVARGKTPLYSVGGSGGIDNLPYTKVCPKATFQVTTTVAWLNVLSRPVNLTARRIKGSRQAGPWKWDWCFARKRRDLVNC
jgi:hypothetical protein